MNPFEEYVNTLEPAPPSWEVTVSAMEDAQLALSDLADALAEYVAAIALNDGQQGES